MVRLLAALIWLFVTPSLAQQGPLTRIAFASCADEAEPQPIWDAVLAYKPQLMLYMGDNIYADARKPRGSPPAAILDALRQSYEMVQRIPGFMAVKTGVPHLATWDDHDFGRNDAGATFPFKRESQAMFLDFWGVPADDARRRRDGVYVAQTFGPAGMRVQVIMLDTRFFRSDLKKTDQHGAPGRERYVPDDDPAKTMLGDAQWLWLEQQLREPADLRVVVSSIQLVAEGHGWERWGNFPRERQRFYDLVRDTKAHGVVIVSGDRHIGALYRETTGVPYPLVEATSSGINKVFAGNREPGPNRVGAVYGAENFGTLDIDWWTREVTLSIRGMNGAAVRQMTVGFDALKGE